MKLISTKTTIKRFSRHKSIMDRENKRGKLTGNYRVAVQVSYTVLEAGKHMDKYYRI